MLKWMRNWWSYHGRLDDILTHFLALSIGAVILALAIMIIAFKLQILLVIAFGIVISWALGWVVLLIWDNFK